MKRTKKYTNNDSPIAIVKNEISGLDFGVVKSLIAYRRNAYRQWGVIANDIIDDAVIGRALVRVIMANDAVTKRMDEISKTRGKDIFQLVELLAFQVDDLKTAVAKLATAISESGVCRRYSNHEAINGRERRLGLRTLQRRTMDTLNKLSNVINDCKVVAAMAYEDYSSAYDGNHWR